MSGEKKHPGGRPLKFESVEDLESKIKAYFTECDTVEEPYTITGLAVALDTSRQTLCEYEERPEFVDTIKRAKDKCEKQIEVMALKGKYNSVFSIFNLKNNYGWKDKQESEVYGENGEALFPKPIMDVTKKDDITT